MPSSSRHLTRWLASPVRAAAAAALVLGCVLAAPRSLAALPLDERFQRELPPRSATPFIDLPDFSIEGSSSGGGGGQPSLDEHGSGESQRRVVSERESRTPHQVDSDDLVGDSPPMSEYSGSSGCECGGVSSSADEGLGAVGQATLWVLLAIAGLILVVAIARAVMRRRKGAKDAPDDALDEQDEQADEDEDAQGAGAPADAVLAALRDEAADADHARLAAEGRFAEAIHALLLEVLTALVRRASLRQLTSLTARELVRELGLDAEARAALGRLVAAAERCHFGLQPADRPAYEQALADARPLLATPAAAPALGAGRRVEPAAAPAGHGGAP